MLKTIRNASILTVVLLALAGCSPTNSSNPVLPEPTTSETSATEEPTISENEFSEVLNSTIDSRIQSITVRNFELYGANNEVLIWSDVEEQNGVIFFGEDTTALLVSNNWSDWGEAKCSAGLTFVAPLYEGFSEFVVTGEVLAIDEEVEDSVSILGYASGPEGVVVGYTKDYDEDNVYYSGTFVNSNDEITLLVRGQIEKNLWKDSKFQLLEFLSEKDMKNGVSYSSKYIYGFAGDTLYGSKSATEWKTLLSEIYDLQIFSGLIYDLNTSNFYVASANEEAIQNGELPEISIKDLEGNEVTSLSCSLIP